MARADPDMSPARSRPLGIQMGYSAANLGKSVVWTSFESLMLFYLVSIAGFEPLTAGALLAVALLWDAAFDLLVARLTDALGGSNSLATLILFGAPLCGIGFWMIFVMHAPVAIAAAIIACRIGYSLCDVGHNTLLIRVAQERGDAARVSGLRLLFSASGNTLLALISGASLSLAGASAQRQAFASGALIGGILYVATLFLAIWVTRTLPAPSYSTVGTRSLRPLRAYWRNGPFRRLLLLVAVQAALVPLFQRALPFYGKAVHADPAWAGPALLTITIAQSLALPGWMAASRRRSSRLIAMASHGVAALALVGLTMASRGVAESVMLAVLGVGIGGMNLAIWALLTSTVQEAMAGEVQEEATSVGLFLAVLKVAAALGSLLFAATVAAGPVRVPLPSGASSGLLPLTATIVPLAGCMIALALLSACVGLSGGEKARTVA